MNDLEIMLDAVKRLLPDVRVELDALNPGTTGYWYAFLEHRGHEVAVEWRPEQGFGLTSAGEFGHGERPDEVYAERAKAAARLVSLLTFQRRTLLRRLVLSRIRESHHSLKIDRSTL